MDSTKIPIPPGISSEIIGFRILGSCWLFAKNTYQPSYWMMLKREGFSGDLLSSSSELEGITNYLDRSMLDDIYRLHHGDLPDHYFDFTLRNDVEHLVLSGQIKVFRLADDKFLRLTDPYDSLYASNESIDLQIENPVVARRYALANELGQDIVARWTKKDAEDLEHWNNFVIWREAIEAYDVGAEAVDTAGDFIVGIWDIGCFVVEIAYEGAKTYIKLQAAYLNTLHNAVTGDFEAIRKDLEAIGVWLDESVDSAQKLVDKAKEGMRVFDELMSDRITRELIYDYLDSLYQSVPYRDSRTLLLRLVFEIGIEVLLAFATAGAANVARRSAQAASTTNKAVKASNTAKRIGPFTQRAIDLMVDLAKVLDKRELKIEHKPAPDLDVPDYAKKPNYKPHEGVAPLDGDQVFKRDHPDGDTKDPYTLQEDGKPLGSKEGVMPSDARGMKKFSSEHQRLIDEEGYPDVSGRGDFENFSDIKPVELKEGDKIYRIVDEGSAEASGKSGTYWARELPENKAAWREGYAVKDSWNDNGYYVEHTVGPEGMKVWEGKTAGQQYDQFNGKDFYLEGGESQLYVEYNSISGLEPKVTTWPDSSI
ncbi:hypothetical protein [Aurantivibrio plasticivorans]